MFTTKEVSHTNTDVLIIGGGSAACRAAIEAFDCGASVTMIVKAVSFTHLTLPTTPYV